MGSGALLITNGAVSSAQDCGAVRLKTWGAEADGGKITGSDPMSIYFE